MRGSILWNIWMMIAGFSLYFLLSFPNGEPLPVILGSFAASAVFFVLMFIIRFMLFVAFPPEHLTAEHVEKERLASQETSEEEITVEADKEAAAKQSEMIDSEKAAAAIREMMNG
ncbi:hypothetical protein [Bacillus sp. REN10]|uniref:hypothetical protein n=1 Tax=Bacillus sp. REN10 TaxID=2782541 RepID=UPI00193B2178|nr:hypothetical protein [Bacillus sp. REN10]